MKEHFQFFAEYIQLYRPFLNELNNLLAPYRLYNSQWAVLKLLKQEGELTSADIAAKRQVEKPSVTKMIQRLAEMGLVQSRLGTDRREKWIALTEAGEEVVKKVTADLEVLYECLLESASVEEIENASKLLRLARTNIDK